MSAPSRSSPPRASIFRLSKTWITEGLRDHLFLQRHGPAQHRLFRGGGATGGVDCPSAARRADRLPHQVAREFRKFERASTTLLSGQALGFRPSRAAGGSPCPPVPCLLRPAGPYSRPIACGWRWSVDRPSPCAVPRVG